MIITNYSLMSEISKARERIMLNKRYQEDQEDSPAPATERQPRKFTVSSLTHHFESKCSDVDHAPATLKSRSRNWKIPESPIEGRGSVMAF